MNIGAKLSEQEKFIEIINRLVKANQEDINKMLEFNNTYIDQKTNSGKDLNLYRKMLGK